MLISPESSPEPQKSASSVQQDPPDNSAEEKERRLSPSEALSMLLGSPTQPGLSRQEESSPDNQGESRPSGPPSKAARPTPTRRIGRGWRLREDLASPPATAATPSTTIPSATAAVPSATAVEPSTTPTPGTQPPSSTAAEPSATTPPEPQPPVAGLETLQGVSPRDPRLPANIKARQEGNIRGDGAGGASTTGSGEGEGAADETAHPSTAGRDPVGVAAAPSANGGVKASNPGGQQPDGAAESPRAPSSNAGGSNITASALEVLQRSPLRLTRMTYANGKPANVVRASCPVHGYHEIHGFQKLPEYLSLHSACLLEWSKLAKQPNEGEWQYLGRLGAALGIETLAELASIDESVINPAGSSEPSTSVADPVPPAPDPAPPATAPASVPTSAGPAAAQAPRMAGIMNYRVTTVQKFATVTSGATVEKRKAEWAPAEELRKRQARAQQANGGKAAGGQPDQGGSWPPVGPPTSMPKEPLHPQLKVTRSGHPQPRQPSGGPPQPSANQGPAQAAQIGTPASVQGQQHSTPPASNPPAASSGPLVPLPPNESGRPTAADHERFTVAGSGPPAASQPMPPPASHTAAPPPPGQTARHGAAPLGPSSAAQPTLPRVVQSRPPGTTQSVLQTATRASLLPATQARPPPVAQWGYPVPSQPPVTSSAQRPFVQPLRPMPHPSLAAGQGQQAGAPRYPPHTSMGPGSLPSPHLPRSSSAPTHQVYAAGSQQQPAHIPGRAYPSAVASQPYTTPHTQPAATCALPQPSPAPGGASSGAVSAAMPVVGVWRLGANAALPRCTSEPAPAARGVAPAPQPGSVPGSIAERGGLGQAPIDLDEGEPSPRQASESGGPEAAQPQPPPPRAGPTAEGTSGTPPPQPGLAAAGEGVGQLAEAGEMGPAASGSGGVRNGLPTASSDLEARAYQTSVVVHGQHLDTAVDQNVQPNLRKPCQAMDQLNFNPAQREFAERLYEGCQQKFRIQNSRLTKLQADLDASRQEAMQARKDASEWHARYASTANAMSMTQTTRNHAKQKLNAHIREVQYWANAL